MADSPFFGVSTAVLRADPFACSPAELHSVFGAASMAGFEGGSLWRMHYELAKNEGMTDAQLLAWLDESGFAVELVEAVTTWADGPGGAFDAEVAPTIELARLVGARQILAVTMNEGTLDRPAAVAGLRVLADRAADAGLKISIEWLPWSALPTLEAAWSLIGEADRDNVGLVFDNWHWLRQPGGPAPELLRRIPGERIHIWQLCDAPAAPDGEFLDETMNRRLLPGEGASDWTELRAIFAEIGARPALAPEPFNPARAAAGPLVYAHAIAEATRRVLGLAAAAG